MDELRERTRNILGNLIDEPQSFQEEISQEYKEVPSRKSLKWKREFLILGIMVILMPFIIITEGLITKIGTNASLLSLIPILLVPTLLFLFMRYKYKRNSEILNSILFQFCILILFILMFIAFIYILALLHFILNDFGFFGIIVFIGLIGAVPAVFLRGIF